MFSKKKWLNINLSEYRDIKIKEKSNDFSIIEGIDFNNNNMPKINNGILSNIPFAIKDNFAIKNTNTTAGSKIIREFKSSFNSTVLERLMNSGAVPLFKANLDELAMGGTGLTSNYGPVTNPFNKDYIVGGSSSGSNYLVADGTVSFSIGSDTGDSVRKPAAHTGIVGFKPTWGLVSRFGLYDFAPTWDTVGWFTNNVKESAVIMDILKGYDEKDQTSLETNEKDFLKDIKLNEKYKIVIIPEFEKLITNKKILEDYKKSIYLLKKDGHEIIEVNDADIKKLSTVLTVYRVISSVEAFSCNSNLTGFHFGSYFNKGNNYDEKITNARTKGFSYEVKKRFLWSQETIYSNKNEYKKATKMRRIINYEINRILSMGDVLMAPTTSSFAENIKEMSDFGKENILDNYLTLFNSNGSPSISMPITKNGHLSTSINISSLPFFDKKVLKIANRLEELL